MSIASTLDTITRDADGSFSWAFGAYRLFSAFQPIVEPTEDGFYLAGYNGQIRVERHGEAITPGEFLASVDPHEMAEMDGQMAVLHICNAQVFAREAATVHVARTPRHFFSLPEMKADATRLRNYALSVGLHPGRIVCELRIREGDDIEQAGQFASHMRRAGFLVGLDGYAGEERDLERVRILRPSFLRFDPAWVADLMKSNAGIALMRVIVGQFRDQNILSIFTCVEDDLVVDTLEKIGAQRLQGHALARPERAPAIFSDRFRLRPLAVSQRESNQLGTAAFRFDPAKTASEPADAGSGARKAPLRRVTPAFGKRGLG